MYSERKKLSLNVKILHSTAMSGATHMQSFEKLLEQSSFSSSQYVTIIGDLFLFFIFCCSFKAYVKSLQFVSHANLQD